MKTHVARAISIVFLTFAFTAAASAETFIANLSPAQEVPPAAGSSAKGYARVTVDPATLNFTFTVVFTGLGSNQTASHIHAPAAIGANVGVAINFGAVGGTSGTISGSGTMTATQLAQIRQHLGYVNVHSVNFPNGEIRGQLGINRPVDFDGDGKQDFSVLRFPNIAPPGFSPLTWYNLNTTSGLQVVEWGDANRDFPAPGDYDGDGKGDIVVYRSGDTVGSPNYFFILRSSDASYNQIQLGVRGDQSVARDYDGDGRVDPAIYRRGATASTPAEWHILSSATGSLTVTSWGVTGNGSTIQDVAVPGDYDGDGKFDIAVYRFGSVPNNSFLVLRSSDGGFTQQPWGNFNTDYVVPGDYDGDGKFDFTVARTGATSTSPMTWWILLSSTGQGRSVSWGRSSDVPVQGDYDGDARTDVAVYRSGATASSASTHYVLNSLDLSAQVVSWGVGADFPTARFDVR